MKIFDLNVPDGISYLNEWKDGNGQPFNLPCGILDKGIPNCGATTLALEDSHKTIICSPRNNLVENKHAQHEGTLLVIGRMSEDEIKRYLSESALPKILVSYDSLPKVARCIPDKSDWRVVIDEYQYLLTDSGFKSEVEKRMVSIAQEFDYVTYLSATPILDKYLTHIDFFRNIPYYRLHWSNIEKVRVIRKRSSNPVSTALEIVKAYKDGHYPCIEVDGKIVYSTECVIFLNSVDNIASIIKKCELVSDEVNIIVGNSEENDKKISKIGNGFSRGRLPLKGEPHKKFTFCTSTAFAGCDFYSTVASSFVICDPMRSNTTIDIATDLVQIAGRQRLQENPFRRFLTMVYKVGDFERSEDEFLADMERRRRLTDSEIADVLGTVDPELREKKIKDIVRLQRMCNFSETFTMYDADSGNVCFNDFAYASQQYVYDLQKHNYANGIAVRNMLESSGFALQGNQSYEASDDYAQQMEQMVTSESFADRMKSYCELRDDNSIYALALNNLESRFPQLKLFYEELGSDRIRALGYKEKELKNEVNIRHLNKRLTEEMCRCFPIGDRLYSRDEIKEIMEAVFTKAGIKKIGKITELEELYKVKMQLVKATVSVGVRKNRYKVVGHLV